MHHLMDLATSYNQKLPGREAGLFTPRGLVFTYARALRGSR